MMSMAGQHERWGPAMPMHCSARGGRRDDLVGRVVAVLLGVEPAPAAPEQRRRLGPEDPPRAGVAVRDVGAGDLVVLVVLAEAALVGVDRRRRVTALGEPPDGPGARAGVVPADVEHEPRVERVALLVQRVAGVLDGRELVARQERDVVQARVRLVAVVGERQLAGTCRRAPLCTSRWMPPQPPADGFSGLVSFVSPVSVNSNSRNCEPGRKTPFSGRLNGVACAAFAATLALNGASPSTAVSWTTTQRVSSSLP